MAPFFHLSIRAFLGQVRPVLRKAWHENDGDLPTTRAKNARAGRGSPGELPKNTFYQSNKDEYTAYTLYRYIISCTHTLYIYIDIYIYNDIRFIYINLPYM